MAGTEENTETGEEVEEQRGHSRDEEDARQRYNHKMSLTIQDEAADGTEDRQRRTSTVIAAARRLSSISAMSRTTLQRHFSRMELVQGPDGESILLEVEEGDFTPRKDSLVTATTIGGIPAHLDRAEIDKTIRTKVAHHNHAVEDGTSDDTPQKKGDAEGSLYHVPGGSVVAFLLRHLHLALASPALFRLPYLVEKHSIRGGSPFLLVYLLMVVVVGGPLCLLEMAMAQYSSLGPVCIYRCLPLFIGVGGGMLLTSFLLMTYCSALVTWCTLYIMNSFTYALPWEECPTNSGPVCTNITYTVGHVSDGEDLASDGSDNITQLTHIPSDYYFLNNVVHTLGNTDGIEFSLEPSMVLLGVWSLLMLCLLRRLTWTTGVVSWLVAAITLCTLVVMLGVGFTLERGSIGVRAALLVNFTMSVEEFSHPAIWVDALGQVLWSLGPGIGLLVMRASHNRFKDPVSLNVWAAVVANVLVAFLVILAVFPFEGELFLSPTVAASPGFFFIIASYAVTRLEVPQMGSFLLFFGFGALMFSHMLMLADTVIESLDEIFRVGLRVGFRRITLGAVVCLLAFGTSIFFVSSDGIYLVGALDCYLPWVAGGLLAVLETVGFVYLYGAHNVTAHLNTMNGTRRTNMEGYWKFVLPVVMLGLQVWGWVVGVEEWVWWPHEETGREVFHHSVGLGLSCLPLLVVLAGSCSAVITYKSLKALLRPQPSWGPALQQHTRLYPRDVLMAVQRRPWLVIQTEGDLVAESGRVDWVPMGYSWLPEDPSFVLLSSALNDLDEQQRQTVVNNFVQRFGLHKSQPPPTIALSSASRSHTASDISLDFVPTPHARAHCASVSNVSIMSSANVAGVSRF